MRKINHETYLQALGLFTLAKNHAAKTEEFRKELEHMLEISPFGHIADAIYDGGELDPALMLEDIEVEKS